MTEIARRTGRPAAARRLATHEQSVLREAELRWDDEPLATLRMLDSVLTPQLRHFDPASSGHGSVLRARVLGHLGSFGEAAAAVRVARHDFLTAGLTLDAYQADLVRSELVRAGGEAARALTIVEGVLEDLPQATTAWPDRHQLDLLRAEAHLQHGLARAATGDHELALRSYDRAWDRFYRLGETAQAARTVAHRATSYLNLDMTHRALDDLQRSRAVLGALGRVVASARCAIPLSHALVRLDRIPEAVQLLEDVRPVFEQRGLRPVTAFLDLAIAEALLHAGLPHDARLEAQSSVAAFTDLHHVDGTTQARVVAGIASLAAGEVDVAMPDLELAERLATSVRMRHELALVRLVELLRSSPRDAPDRARTLGALAHVAADGGDSFMAVVAALADALATPEGLGAQRQVADAARLIDVHDLYGLEIARAIVATRVQRHRGDAQAAAAELMSALTCLSSEGAHAHGAYRPLTQLLLVAVADHDLLDVLLGTASPAAVTDAWRWAAVTRARSLTDLASSTQHLRARHDAPPLPVHRGAELALLSDALDQLIDPAADVDLAAIRDTHVAVRRDIRQQIPHARLPLRDDGEVDLPPVPEGPVLQFHVLGDEIVAFVVREGQVYARRLVDTMTDVESFAAEWHAECSRVQRMPVPDRGPHHHSLDALGALLLLPLDDLLADLEGLPLVVVAPARLQAVPFEALPLRGRPLSSLFSLRFAAGMHDLSALCLDEGTDVDHGTSVLALMVSDEQTPRIADETRALAAIHPDATVLTGADATVEALGRRARHHDVVHVACHGLYWPEHPSSSGLRLGDRWVTAGEILRMDLRGCLVILNACATGRAYDTTSESVGLTWALLAAGARGVVATTWPVDDSVALAFATSFHQHLRAGLPAPEAVREAGVDVSERFSDHPWAWAAHRYVASGSTVLAQS